MTDDTRHWLNSVHAGPESYGDADAVAHCGDRVYTLPHHHPEDISAYCPQHGPVDWLKTTPIPEKFP